MNPKPLPPGMHPLCTIIVAGTLSCLIAIGLVVGIVELFLRDGTPLQNVIIAQQACSEFSFVSERDACVKRFLAASDHRRVARR